MIILGNKAYLLSDLTPYQVERIISALTAYQVENINDVPQGVKVCSKIISIALIRGSILKRFKRFFLCRRLAVSESVEKLTEVSLTILESIPVQSFYDIQVITQELNKNIKK